MGLSKYLLLYDSDCGPCTRFKRASDFLDAHRKIDFMPIDEAEELGLLDELQESRRHGSFHLVLPSREIESGTEALPTLIGLFPLGRLFSRAINSTPGGVRVLKFVYSTAARLHEAGSCKMDTSTNDRVDIGERPDIATAARTI